MRKITSITLTVDISDDSSTSKQALSFNLKTFNPDEVMKFLNNNVGGSVAGMSLAHCYNQSREPNFGKSKYEK